MLCGMYSFQYRNENVILGQRLVDNKDSTILLFSEA